jgi:hypothetical protein
MLQSPRLVERLLVSHGPKPPPGDETITETDGETDSWMSGDPPKPDTITKEDGERDRWGSLAVPRPGPDTITRQGAETDVWGSENVNRPKPSPPDDIITLDDREGDSWS